MRMPMGERDGGEGGGGRGIYLRGEWHITVFLRLIITRCRVSAHFFFARLRILAGANAKTIIFSDNYEDGSGYKRFLFDRSRVGRRQVVTFANSLRHVRPICILKM